MWRTLAILPLARLQSVSVRQGPLYRSLRLAGTNAHTIIGPVSGRMGALDRDAALELFTTVEANTVAAAARDRTHRWADDESELPGEEPPVEQADESPKEDAGDGA